VECRGVWIRTTDAQAFRPVLSGLALLADIIAVHKEEFEWTLYRTVANPEGRDHFERIVGRGAIREELDTAAEKVSNELLRSWTATPGWPERWRAVQQYE